MGKGKHKKEDREKLVRNIRKEKTENEKKEIAYGIELRRANRKMEYIRNLIPGRYYFARCNMIAGQLNRGAIEEKIDGLIKSEELMRTEYAMMKMQAINCMRTAHFAKKDLKEEFGLTKKDIETLEKDYYDGKIIREEYDEEVRRKGKAEFVNSPKD